LSIPYEILRLILKMTLQLIIDSAEGGRIPKIPDKRQKLSGITERIRIGKYPILIEVKDQYDGLYISGKTIGTTKIVVYRERSSGASNYRPWHIMRT